MWGCLHFWDEVFFNFGWGCLRANNDTHRHRHTDTDTDTQAQTHRHTDTEIQTQGHRHTDTQTHKTHRHRQTNIDTDKDTHIRRHKDTNTDTQTQTNRHTDTDTRIHRHVSLIILMFSVIGCITMLINLLLLYRHIGIMMTSALRAAAMKNGRDVILTVWHKFRRGSKGV